jgi:hypothetical protein
MNIDTSLRALSIRQPWAWAITHGPKRIENRSWRTNYRGLLLLHASKGRNRFRRNCESLAPIIELPEDAAFTRGAIVGVAELVDCVDVESRPELAANPFADPGSIWWLLQNVRAFSEPIPYTGSLNLFRVPRELVAHAL